MQVEQLEFVKYLWYAASLALLVVWLKRSAWGRDAFAAVCPRPHQLSLIDVLFVLFLYLAVALVRVGLLGEEEGTFRPGFLLALIGGQLFIVVVILLIATRQFTGGLKGFGLTHTSAGGTVVCAAVYFVVATGLTLLALEVTVYLCQAVGYDQVQKHLMLERLAQRPPLVDTLLIVVAAAVGAPLAEELMFRGVVQSYLVSLFSRAARSSRRQNTSAAVAASTEQGPTDYGRWMGIAAAAFVFAFFHANWQHGPALVVLGLFLGYAYERYGNLLIPIVMHSLFNLLPLALTLLTSSQT